MVPERVPQAIAPSAASTAAFVGIVLALCVLVVLGVWRTSPTERRTRRTAGAALGVVAVLVASAILAESGAVRALAGGLAFLLYPAFWNGLALALALSPIGKSLAQALPVAALVGVQAFRLPLELVLHSWYVQGVLPVQMTYSGHNFDIVTGGLAVVVGLFSWRRTPPRVLIWGFNLIGLALLVAVVRIALLSSPVPFRSYLEGPPVELAFHAPYTWILPICVAGALFGHVLTFRWLLQRSEPAGRDAARAPLAEASRGASGHSARE
jgi:hypothetical protein